MMAQDKQPTRIVLRRFKNHYRQIVALMPDIQADYQGNIESYMHIGHHSAAAPGFVRSKDTRPVLVKPGQPVDGSPTTDALALLLELARIGYLPKVGRWVMRDTGVMEVWNDAS
jgi:hypothetical protein